MKLEARRTYPEVHLRWRLQAMAEEHDRDSRCSEGQVVGIREEKTQHGR